MSSMKIAIVDERGGVEKVVAGAHLVAPVSCEAPESAVLLAAIDAYGDTTFNHLQMSRFRAEWLLLRNATVVATCSNLI